MNETMYTYILEEEEVCKKVLKERKEKTAPFLEILKNNNSDKLVFLATGSSVNALNCAKYYIENMLNMEVQIKMPGTFIYYDKVFDKDSIVIAISQGGKSTSTIDALKKAKEMGAKDVLVVTGNVDSPICSYVSKVIDINCGEEKVGYVTKGFTATVLTLMLMALEGAYLKNKIDEEIYNLEIMKLEKVISKIPDTIKKSNDWYEANKEEFALAKRMKTVGYGPSVGVASESNTKIAETVRIPISSFELEEYTHGPYLELKDDHYMFFLKTYGDMKERIDKLEEYSKRTTNYCYTITYEETAHDKKTLALGYDEDEDFSTLLFVIPIQILSYRLAEDKGIPLGIRIFTDFHSCLSSKLQ